MIRLTTFETNCPTRAFFGDGKIGSFEYIAAVKEGDMTVNRLEGIMGEFPEALDVVQQLCLRIRSIMFGDTARLSFGTPTRKMDQLYRSMIAARNEAIGNI